MSWWILHGPMLYTLQLMYCLVLLISYTLTFLAVFDFNHSSSSQWVFSYFTLHFLPVVLIKVYQKIDNNYFIIFYQHSSIFTLDNLFKFLVISFCNSFSLLLSLLVFWSDFTKNYSSICLPQWSKLLLELFLRVIYPLSPLSYPSFSSMLSV